jgi:CMP-N,N'-diacetyllegionaminic acid synthase
MSGILGLIPARAGSVGVPGKNIRPLAGRPLICYAVEAARQSGIGRVVVTTDSEDIAAVAVAAGAERPFLRPPELATGTALAIGVVRHALKHFQAQEGWTPDAVFYLQPTSPFRTADDIDKAIAMLAAAPSADSVSSMAPVRDHPAFAWVERGGGMVRAFPDIPRPERRQDLSPMFAENNAIMLSRTSYLLSEPDRELSIINIDNFVPFPIDDPLTVDIDTETDFGFADFLMRRRLGVAA